MHAHSGGRSTSTAGCQAGRCWRDWHSAVRTLPATRHARLLTDTRAEGRTAHPHLAHVHNHHSAPRGVSRAHRIQTKRMTKLTPTVNVMMPVRILSRASTQQHAATESRQIHTTVEPVTTIKSGPAQAAHSSGAVARQRASHSHRLRAPTHLLGAPPGPRTRGAVVGRPLTGRHECAVRNVQTGRGTWNLP